METVHPGRILYGLWIYFSGVVSVFYFPASLKIPLQNISLISCKMKIFRKKTHVPDHVSNTEDMWLDERRPPVELAEGFLNQSESLSAHITYTSPMSRSALQKVPGSCSGQTDETFHPVRWPRPLMRVTLTSWTLMKAKKSLKQEASVPNELNS